MIFDGKKIFHIHLHTCVLHAYYSIVNAPIVHSVFRDKFAFWPRPGLGIGRVCKLFTRSRSAN